MSGEQTSLDDLMAQLDSMDVPVDAKGFLTPEAVIGCLETETANILVLDLDMDMETWSLSPGILIQILRNIQPSLYVITVTQYITLAVEAFKARANAFLVKPVFPDDFKKELCYYQKFHSAPAVKRIMVKTFGNFDVFVDGKPLVFHRTKSKELLAYLVDRRGGFITNGQAISILWEDRLNDKPTSSMYRTILASLVNTLETEGISYILVKRRNNLAVDATKIECDYYRLIEGKPLPGNVFAGEYMSNYGWAESTAAFLQRRFMNIPE